MFVSWSFDHWQNNNLSSTSKLKLCVCLSVRQGIKLTKSTPTKATTYVSVRYRSPYIKIKARATINRNNKRARSESDDKTICCRDKIVKINKNSLFDNITNRTYDFKSSARSPVMYHDVQEHNRMDVDKILYDHDSSMDIDGVIDETDEYF